MIDDEAVSPFGRWNPDLSSNISDVGVSEDSLVDVN